MNAEAREELTGWGQIVWGEKSFNKIYYKVIVEQEDNEEEEPDIYGSLNDKRGDQLAIEEFIGSEDDIKLYLSDGRYLKIVFLDDSGEFEVIGGFRSK